jgi:hypothetical protein
MPEDKDLILTVLNEIRTDQKAMVEKLNTLTNSQLQLKTELEISRNGYTPHEVVELLHWTKDQKEKVERRDDQIRKTIIGWVVPILCSAVIFGLLHMNK